MKTLVVIVALALVAVPFAFNGGVDYIKTLWWANTPPQGIVWPKEDEQEDA